MLVVAGCHSADQPAAPAAVPIGPSGKIRVALADFRWPLDPALAATRDETTLARLLYATPLRTDAGGRLRPGLCSEWSASRDFRTWRFTCRSAHAIAGELRRVARLQASPSRWLFHGARITAPSRPTVVVRLAFGWRRFPYALTAVAAAPRGVQGPFRLVRGTRARVVVRSPGGMTIVFRRLSPTAAVRAFRAGRLDEAPVPTGDVDALRAVFDVRVRRLLGMDVVVFGSYVGRRLRRAYSDTANRADYEALLGTSLALGLRGNGGKPDPAAFRRALKAIPKLPRVAVRLGRPPELDYGADILYGQWREAGLGPVLVPPGESHVAELTRLIAAYPQAEALPAALSLGDRVGARRTLLRALARVNQEEQLAVFDRELHATARAIPIAWVTDARLVSRRLRDWHEDVLGNVDYARVRLRG